VIVLDSVGIGELPDAGAYGDQGSDTLGHIADAVPLSLPALRSLGLDRVARLGPAQAPAVRSRYETAAGRMAEA
jgi:phosphopentomutase